MVVIWVIERWLTISTLVCLQLVLFSFQAHGSSFYRYLDITPVMALLPRAQFSDSVWAQTVCYRLTSSGDSLEVVKLDHGNPVSVFNFQQGFSVVASDSVISWAGTGGSGYVIRLDSLGRAVVVLHADEKPLLEIQWLNDSTVEVYTLDSTGERLEVDVVPSYTGVAERLNNKGDLELFRYETVHAAAWRYTLNESGRVQYKWAVDAAGDTVSTSDGVAVTQYTYDDSWNLTSTRLLDRNGHLLPYDYSPPDTGNYQFDRNNTVVNQVTIAYIERQYDQNSLYVVEKYIDTAGALTQNSLGVATTEYQRDPGGGISESVWFDISGERTEIGGVCVTRRLFNNQGRVIESSTYNSEDEITEFPGGFAYTRFSYAEDGQPVLISYYNKQGQPVINTSLGCHARSYAYNASGLCTETRYLGIDYHLVTLATGYARVVSVFDESGELTEQHFFDAEGVEVFK